jgi:hypothetical protein
VTSFLTQKLRKFENPNKISAELVARTKENRYSLTRAHLRVKEKHKIKKKLFQ